MALWTLTLNVDGTVSAGGLALHYAPLTLTVPAGTKGPVPVVNAGDVTGSYGHVSRPAGRRHRDDERLDDLGSRIDTDASARSGRSLARRHGRLLSGGSAGRHDPASWRHRVARHAIQHQIPERAGASRSRPGRCANADRHPVRSVAVVAHARRKDRRERDAHRRHRERHDQTRGGRIDLQAARDG